MKIVTEREKINKEDFPLIVERIFNVCKNDDTFDMKDTIQEKEKLASRLIQKLEKKESLYEKVSKIRKDLQRRIQDLDQRNIELQESLLGELGSEI